MADDPSSTRLRRVLFVLLAILAACTPARKEVRTDIVRRLRFEGNGGLLSGHNDLQLRTPMEQRQSPPLTFTWPFMYLTAPSPLSLDTLHTDARRLEVWYAEHGWFDAQVLGWEIRRARVHSDKRAGVVDVLGHVATGPQSMVRTIDVRGHGKKSSEVVIQAAMRGAPLKTDTPFDLDTVHETQRLVVDELEDNTFAYATTELTVDAYPDQNVVDITLDVHPGISTRFGEVRIHGLTRVQESVVRDALSFRTGESFRISVLRTSQQRLFETKLFSLVDVKPDLSDPKLADVPIDITLTEARFRRIRAGAGVVFDYYTVGPRANLEFRDLRLFGSDLQLEAKAGAGAIIGVVQEGENQGSNVVVTGLGSLRLEDPWLVNGRLGVTTGATFNQDVQFGTLPFWSIDADFGLRYRFSRYTTLTGGPRFQYFRYLQPSDATIEAARLQFGGDFNGTTYRLLSIDAAIAVDYRDDPITTRRGSYWRLHARQSVPIPPIGPVATDGPADPGFLYTKVEAEVRAFWPIKLSRRQSNFPFVLAARGHGTAVVPWAKDAALPYPELAFLGGPNSLRGFRSNQVGPYDCICSYKDGRPNPQSNNGQAYQVDRTYLPRGGAFAIEAELEVRYDWAYNISFAVFGDVGLLTRDWKDLSLASFRGSGGVGVRYASPVGPVRLDVGMRPVYPEDRAASSYIGCNPIDRLPRGYDVLTAGRAAREQLGDRTFPMALNLFLAIGQAF